MQTLTRVKSKVNEVKEIKEMTNNINTKLSNLYKKIDSFTNVDGINKDAIRLLIISLIINKFGTTLTLPYKKAKMEKLMLKMLSKKMNFIGYEKDKNVYYELCKLIGEERLPITAIPGNIGDAIFKAKEDEFSNLILDYCGVLDSFADEIEYAIKNNIMQVNGLMAITLSKIGLRNNTGVIGEIFRTIPMEMFNSELGQTELGCKLFLNKILTKNYKVIDVKNYHDDKEDGTRGMAMICLLIRRIA
jgi:hypothetical protein